jgi:hypothetical protein
MIYIISKHRESATDEVIAYCIQKKMEITRLDYEDMPIRDLTINISNEKVGYNIVYLNQDLPVTEKDILWFRRGSIQFKYSIKEKILSKFCSDFLEEEYGYISENLYTIPSSISSYQADPNNNKLDNLIYAKHSGLKIPATIVTSTKKDALTFLRKYDFCISKPLNNAHLDGKVVGELYIASKGTFKVNEEDFLALDDTFIPMLMQQYIPKVFELRIFYFMEKFYPMAIFSQKDEKTTLDYRNYNEETPNRCVPYTLPDNIVDSLKKFIDKIQLKTGSFDLIYSTDDNYYFLEVNPNGQFGWVSDNCNYYIEKNIADQLNNLHDGR